MKEQMALILSFSLPGKTVTKLLVSEGHMHGSFLSPVLQERGGFWGQLSPILALSNAVTNSKIVGNSLIILGLVTLWKAIKLRERDGNIFMH